MSTTLARTTEAQTRGFTREAVEALSRAKGEPEWALEARLAAFDIYEAAPMPTTQDEEWRRTSIRALKLDQVRPFGANGGAVASLDEVPAEARAGLELGGVDGRSPRAGLLVQHNSEVIYTALDEAVAARGVIFESMDEAVRRHPDIVRRYFMTEAVKPTHDKFAALHGAFWSGGTFIYVPRNVAVELPLQSRIWAEADAPAVMAHTLIVAEEGAQVAFIDEFVSPTAESAGAQGFSNGAVELYTGAGAQIRYFSVQDWGRHVYHFNTQRVVADRDSTTNSLTILLGSKLTKANVESALDGPGASSEMLGIYFGDGTQHFDQHTMQDHRKPHTTSDLLFKGVLRDRGRSVFAGLIRVEPGAQRTDAYQANRNLMLSEHARVDSMPKLEIGANDVRCTHGATMGQVEPEYLFYLQSRGLERAEAERLIVEGFLDEIVQRIPLEEVRDRLAVAIQQKMGLPPKNKEDYAV
ncbi:MAG: Iron-sulfur cluster assembly protein SufD [uncultured Thermomicrobiales bacterium]|uniref:Iron-sulfur cluster assembly protein SufD n=1 Tax=uncultured Thermomicrobiales bacterium TaxID=1645740 RepID=A0A6J4V365_9BACT|nr:MAG: Iron-sulfur cluster assembly protein SufD [uncultured Thermomicrobiales bacterium]